MSFKDIKYFQKYVSTSISKYNSNPQAFLESDIRSIFSRAYYTIFLHCRDELGLEYDTQLSIHAEVKKQIQNERIQKLFHSYHEKRKKMDYNNVSIDMGNIGKLTSELKAIERDMNYILNLNKDQLYRT